MDETVPKSFLEYWVGTYFGTQQYYQVGIKTDFHDFKVGVGLEKSRGQYQITSFVGYPENNSIFKPHFSLEIPLTHRERGIGAGFYLGLPLIWNKVEFEPVVGLHHQHHINSVRSGIRVNF